MYIDLEASRKTGALLHFGEAIDALKSGRRVARAGWNGKGMWLTLVSPYPGDKYDQYPMQSYIAMKTADDKMQPGWLASQADMLAEDWEVVG